MIQKDMIVNLCLRKSFVSLALFVVLLSCSKKDELVPVSGSNNNNGIILHVEGEQGSSIELDQDFLKDFRASTYGKPIAPAILHFSGKKWIGMDVWPYTKKELYFKEGDNIFTSPLRLSKGGSHLDLVCYYLWSSKKQDGEEIMYGGNGITLVKVIHQGKSYERHEEDGLILPLIWSHGRLQVK